MNSSKSTRQASFGRTSSVRPPGSQAPPPKGPAGSLSARARLAAEQERKRRARRGLIMVVVPIAVVLVAVGVLVAVRLTGLGSKSGSATGGSAVISAVTSVPPAVLDQVGVGSVTQLPKAASAPALTDASGKPRILYVGAEYCPYCAAERWAVVVALSRFGTFTGLGQTTSSASDIFPSTPTLTFHGSAFTSKTVAFTGVETESNQPANGGYAPLDTLSAADQQIFTTYNSPPYVDDSGSIPFIDIGGKYLIAGASYSPQVLQGKTHEQVAAALSDPKSAIAQGADGTANLITAAICASTNNAPATVCNSAGVQAAAKQLP